MVLLVPVGTGTAVPAAAAAGIPWDPSGIVIDVNILLILFFIKKIIYQLIKGVV
jgi:hypothetical protein